MASITALSYETPSPQVSLGRARLEQARREADQAEAFARQMRSAADQAELEANKGEEKVSTLRTQLAQTQSESTYTNQIKKQIAPLSTPGKQEVLANLSTVARNGFSFPDNPLKAYSRASSLGGPAVKSSGLILSRKV